MGRINLIKLDTDLSKLGNPMGWDLEINGKPYDVYRIEGFIHTIGGGNGENCNWACPAGEKPTFQNLIEFDGEAPTWGIMFDQVNRIKTKWDETRIEKSGRCWITRNGANFYNIPTRDMDFGLATARHKLVMLMESPINIGMRGWKEELRGRKIWWRDQPAIVQYVSQDNELYIVPDETSHFSSPPSFGPPGSYSRYEDGLFADLLSPNVGWFRD